MLICFPESICWKTRCAKDGHGKICLENLKGLVSIVIKNYFGLVDFFLDFLKILNIILNPKSYCFKLLYRWGFLIFLGYGALISESGLAMPDLV